MTPKLVVPGGRSGVRPFRRNEQLVCSGAEVVALAERFYLGLFAGVLVIVAIAALAALSLLPFRDGGADPPWTAILGAGALMIGSPVALWRVQTFYCALRRYRRLQWAVVAYAAFLVAAVLPLRSQLWWPSCALLMLLAVVAPLRRALAQCGVVLGMNLMAHVVAGDLTHAPAVSIIGLWIGYIFWTTLVAAVTNQLAAYILTLNEVRGRRTPPPRRVSGWMPIEQTEEQRAWVRQANAEDWVSTDGHGSKDRAGNADASSNRDDVGQHAGDPLYRLTARQLEVVALLADGQRYKEIAACLSISEGQVQRHVAQAVARLGLKAATELVALAIAVGMVPANDHSDESAIHGEPAVEQPMTSHARG